MPLTLQWSEDISHGQICKQHPFKGCKISSKWTEKQEAIHCNPKN